MAGVLGQFYPFGLAEGAFRIDYEQLYECGYRGIIFDVDQTLVPHGFDSNSEVDSLFRILHGIGFTTLLLSDNSEQRLRNFARNLETAYISNAQKPRRESYLKALMMMGLPPTKIVQVADRVLWDVYGANRSGIVTILVPYLSAPNEEAGRIGARRSIDNLILTCYASRQRRQRRWDRARPGEAA